MAEIKKGVLMVFFFFLWGFLGFFFFFGWVSCLFPLSFQFCLFLFPFSFPPRVLYGFVFIFQVSFGFLGFSSFFLCSLNFCSRFG